ncbi:hypothetical protein [Methylobacterium flocculans]|nr:hypothetical protein [Methylobacterium sp. FF17]
MPRYETSGVRRRSYRAYLNFDRVAAGRIDGLRILKRVQDYAAILCPSG